MRFWSWPSQLKSKLTADRDTMFAIGMKGGGGDMQSYNVIPGARAVFLCNFALRLYEGKPAQTAFDETMAILTPKAVENLCSDLRP